MRTTLFSSALALLLLAGCSRDAAVVPAAGAAVLPPDVRDLAKPAGPAAAGSKSDERPPATIAATGELVSPMRSQVAPKQPGRVAAVFVREGARVRAGQPLAAFETEYLHLDLQRAEAELARAVAMVT